MFIFRKRHLGMGQAQPGAGTGLSDMDRLFFRTPLAPPLGHVFLPTGFFFAHTGIEKAKIHSYGKFIDGGLQCI